MLAPWVIVAGTVFADAGRRDYPAHIVIGQCRSGDGGRGMSIHWTFGRKLAFGFTIAGLVLLALAAVGLRSTRIMIDNDRLVKHSHEVRTELALLLARMTDVETNQRGYLVALDEEFLRDYEHAIPKVESSISALATLTANDTAQQQRIATRLRPAVSARVIEMRRVIEERRRQIGHAAAPAMDIGRGAQLMDQVREAVAEMDANELSLLEQRRSTSQQSASWAQVVLVLGAVLGVLFIGITGALISGSLTRQVSSAVLDIRGSATELQAAAHQQAAAAKQQATAMSEIATTMTELLATSRQITDIARRVTDMALRTAQVTQTGHRTVQRGSESAAAMKRDVESLAGHMGSLSQKAERIEAILDIVAELAKQTNILAINATIEAVGAAEGGQRFGVVAEEIRRLADRVGGSTKEVRVLLEDVRGAVGMAAQSTDSGVRAVTAGARQFEDISAAFGDITAEVSTSTEAAKEIGLSTKQQASAIEQVNLAIASAAQSTKESEASSGQTLKTADALVGLSTTLLQMVQTDSGAAARHDARADATR